MIEATCDVWDMYDQGKTICVTTNGFVKRNGQAVMGRGVAAQVAGRFPDFPMRLGDIIAKYGNVVYPVMNDILSFPVKPKRGICRRNATNVVEHMRGRFSQGDKVPGWALMADLDIIQRSLWELHLVRLAWEMEEVYLPRPGCGAGGLQWETVRPLCEIYQDWLVVVTKEGRNEL